MNLLFVTQFYLQSTCKQFAIHLLTCDSTLLAIYLHYNLQSTCSFVPQFYLQSTCTEFAINLLLATQFHLRSTRLQLTIKLALSTSTSTGIPIAYNLQSNLLSVKLIQLAYTLPKKLQSVALCLQLQMAYKLPAICIPLLFAYNFNLHSNCLQLTINLLFAALQLQLAFKLPTIYNPLLFDYNFNWHSNCLPFTINLLFAKLLQLAFKLPAICNLLLLPTTSTGIPTACNLHSVAL